MERQHLLGGAESDMGLFSKTGYPVVVYAVSGQPVWEGKTDGVSGTDG
jgi:hypothetical protein